MGRQRRPNHPVELDVAARLVGEAQERVDRQRELLARLRREGSSTDQAKRFLALLESTLLKMMRHEEIIMAKIKEDNVRTS
jgi:hypothetical protein